MGACASSPADYCKLLPANMLRADVPTSVVISSRIQAPTQHDSLIYNIYSVPSIWFTALWIRLPQPTSLQLLQLATIHDATQR